MKLLLTLVLLFTTFYSAQSAYVRSYFRNNETFVSGYFRGSGYPNYPMTGGFPVGGSGLASIGGFIGGGNSVQTDRVAELHQIMVAYNAKQQARRNAETLEKLSIRYVDGVAYHIVRSVLWKQEMNVVIVSLDAGNGMSLIKTQAGRSLYVKNLMELLPLDTTYTTLPWLRFIEVGNNLVDVGTRLRTL